LSKDGKGLPPIHRIKNPVASSRQKISKKEKNFKKKNISVDLDISRSTEKNKKKKNKKKI
jgi:hypothetical protein